MRKTNVVLIIALTLALFASVALNQVRTASAQEVPPVGIVVAYVPGQSITIVDQQGTQHEYMLSASLKILPPGRGNALAVGSFVTIIAPASLDSGKQTAVGIVVHPHVPNGWNVPSMSATPLASPTGTLATSETPVGTLTTTETATETPIVSETATLTETPTPEGALTDTPTPTETPIGGGTTISTNSLIEWLRSLLRQLLSNS